MKITLLLVRMRIYSHIVTFLISLFFVVSINSLGFAQSQLIPIHNISADDVSLQNFDIYVLEDMGKNLVINDVVSGTTKGVQASSRFYVESSDVTYWLCFTLMNTSQQLTRKIISLDEPFADDVTFL